MGQEGDKIVSFYETEELEALLLSFVDKQKAPLSVLRDVYPDVIARQEAEERAKSEKKKVKVASAISFSDVVVDGLMQLPYHSCKLCQPKAGDKIIAKVDKA